MRLDDLDPSKNASDLGRGRGGFSRGGGGGLALLLNFLPLLFGRKLGCGTVLLIAAVGGYFLFAGGGMQMLSGAGGSSQTASGTEQACDTQEELFACRVLASTEQTWSNLFQQQGEQYRPAQLKFFTDQINSGCGPAQSAMGPFYCPADQSIYIDVTFFNELERRMGAGGDFARAYVIAHEVAHHIQTITGVSNQVRQAQSRASQAQGNALQVRMELQADCYAGVWAARNADRIEPGDIEEGMTAANAIGDDTIMRSAGQRVKQENFTHGTSEQRMRWLRKGLQTGDPAQCDTFDTNQL